ncbi:MULTISPECIES: transposase [unclassified Ensifer]|uniref:IS66-like element accessory protein TnpA n=1 Tax=unclassified Ensifer TaxID=2633371 RepID=UPI000B26890F|nr:MULTISPECIES: transposase [unclassified Ensifer]
MMDLVPVESDEQVVPHSADDCHQHYAQGNAERARSTSRRVEVIIGEDRRRRWSPEDKAKITAASFVPGANISAVARQYGVSQGLLHYWRHCARESASDEQEMRFVPVVKLGDEQPQPCLGRSLTVRVEINGACVVIDGGVDEQALRTVFSALRGSA